MNPAPDLHIATEADAGTVGERIRRLQAEAKRLAKDHVRAWIVEMTAVQVLAAEIAEGGDAYPAGVRELASRSVEDLEARIATLEAVVARVG